MQREIYLDMASSKVQEGRQRKGQLGGDLEPHATSSLTPPPPSHPVLICKRGNLVTGD